MADVRSAPKAAVLRGRTGRIVLGWTTMEVSIIWTAASVATRYDKLTVNYLAFVQLASIRLWLRVNESAP